jgi:hypothetical protein
MRWLAPFLFLGLALAQGLVLPFEGPRGYTLAQAFAEGLKAPPPTLLALLLPEPPWRDGYELVGGLYSRAGARLAREITGADWVLLGREEPEGPQALPGRERGGEGRPLRPSGGGLALAPEGGPGPQV